MTGLFYVNANRAYSIYYLYEVPIIRRAGAATTAAAGRKARSKLSTIKTGKIRWSHKWEGGTSRRVCFQTAGNLIFTGAPGE